MLHMLRQQSQFRFQSTRGSKSHIHWHSHSHTHTLTPWRVPHGGSLEGRHAYGEPTGWVSGVGCRNCRVAAVHTGYDTDYCFSMWPCAASRHASSLQLHKLDGTAGRQQYAVNSGIHETAPWGSSTDHAERRDACDRWPTGRAHRLCLPAVQHQIGGPARVRDTNR